MKPDNNMPERIISVDIKLTHREGYDFEVAKRYLEVIGEEEIRLAMLHPASYEWQPLVAVDVEVKKSESVSKKDIEKLMYELEQEMTRHYGEIDLAINYVKDLLEPEEKDEDEEEE